MNIVKKFGKEGLYFDMHFHTNYSDGSTRLNTVERICNKNHIGVAITDHNEIRGCLNALNHDFLFIPGIETRSKENIDILFYFYDVNELAEFYKKVIRKNMISKIKYRGLGISAVEILELSKGYNCVSCVPHPFSFLHFAGIVKENGAYRNKGRYKDGLGIVKLTDAIEVMNGHLLKKGNRKALELAHDMNKAFTGGSDGHIRFDLGKILTYAKGDDVDDFLKQVLNKKNEIYSCKGGLRRMMISRTWAFRKHVIHPIHYINRFINQGKNKLKDNG